MHTVTAEKSLKHARNTFSWTGLFEFVRRMCEHNPLSDFVELEDISSALAVGNEIQITHSVFIRPSTHDVYWRLSWLVLVRTMNINAFQVVRVVPVGTNRSEWYEKYSAITTIQPYYVS